MGLFDSLKTDVGIDLGTANTLVYLKGSGIIINEPTVIAVNNKTGQVVAIGHEAKQMEGRTPAHIDVIRPLINGVISDFVMAQEILRHYLKRVRKDSLLRYVRAVIAIPTNLTEVERKSVEDAVISSGASHAYLLEEPVAAVLGAGLPIYEPTASMIVDIGGGTCEIAVISLGGVVVSRSLKIAGDHINDHIVHFVRDNFKLAIGMPSAERIKIEVGSALPGLEAREIVVGGRDTASGLPREIVVKDVHVRAAIMPLVKQMVDAIRETIEKTPPELAGDILQRGIYFSGGGSLLRGLPELVEHELSVKTIMVDDPLTCVVRGAGIAVEDIDRYQNIFSTVLKPIELE